MNTKIKIIHTSQGAQQHEKEVNKFLETELKDNPPIFIHPNQVSHHTSIHYMTMITYFDKNKEQ